jgi:hypothetical protein
MSKKLSVILGLLLVSATALALPPSTDKLVKEIFTEGLLNDVVDQIIKEANGGEDARAFSNKSAFKAVSIDRVSKYDEEITSACESVGIDSRSAAVIRVKFKKNETTAVNFYFATPGGSSPLKLCEKN